MVFFTLNVNFWRPDYHHQLYANALAGSRKGNKSMDIFAIYLYIFHILQLSE